jgi:hypothetical protein
MRGTILLIILTIAGPFLTFMGLDNKALNERLAKDGKTVPGIIEGGEWKKGRKGGKTYKFDVSFKPENGPAVNKKMKVDSTYFNQHVSGDAISNPLTTVRYNPAKPEEESVIEGQGEDLSLMIYIGPVLALIGLGGLFYKFKSRKAAQASAPAPTA